MRKTHLVNQGRVNWIVNGQLSQLVYSEPAFANVAIQKLLQTGAQYGLETTQLDVIQEVVAAYLDILQARSFVEIQNQNVLVTKQNYDIARVKEAVGYSGASDLNRWKSELALNKIDLNDAQAQFRQARYALNALLNYDIDADFITEDIGLESQVLYVTDQRMYGSIHDEGELDALADFLVSEAMANLPVLKQIDVNLSAQERLLLSQKRKNYLPSVGFTGNHRLLHTTLGSNPSLRLTPAFRQAHLESWPRPSNIHFSRVAYASKIFKEPNCRLCRFRLNKLIFEIKWNFESGQAWK